MPRRLLALALLLLGACGGGEAEEPAARERARSEAAAASLARLLARVEAGDVKGVATEADGTGSALWAPTPEAWSPERDAAIRMHKRLAVIAVDVARSLEGDDPEAGRATWRETDPVSLEVHDAWSAAAAAGPDAYRRWVETEGTTLLERRLMALSER